MPRPPTEGMGYINLRKGCRWLDWEACIMDSEGPDNDDDDDNDDDEGLEVDIGGILSSFKPCSL